MSKIQEQIKKEDTMDKWDLVIAMFDELIENNRLTINYLKTK